MDEHTAPRRATLADLTAQTYQFEIESPDGEILLVELRALTQADVLTVERELGPLPDVPVSDFRTDDQGKPYPIYNENDPGYRAAVEARNVRRLNHLILRMWCMELPGETDDARIAALDDLAAWAKGGLYRAVGMLTSSAGDSVKMHRFQSRREPVVQPLIEDALD